MISLIVGCALGIWISRAKVGLAVVLLYGVVAGVISANASFRDGAGFWPVILALVGFGLSRLYVAARNAIKAMRTRPEATTMKNNGVLPSSEPAPQPTQLDRTTSCREDLYIAAGLAHATVLGALGRELDDVEFVASAIGAFDGAAQALDRKLGDVDMLAMGSTFALRQIRDLQRMQDASPEAKGDVIGRAMTSQALEALRAQSGRISFIITSNSPPTGPAIA